MKAEGREREWDSWGGQRAHSPPDRGLGSAMSSPAGWGRSPDPPKVFPLFSALRMASPDNILLLMVDYHAAIGDKTPVPPLHTPCLLVVLVKLSVLAK